MPDHSVLAKPRCAALAIFNTAPSKIADVTHGLRVGA